jgi:hypothetical protein
MKIDIIDKLYFLIYEFWRFKMLYGGRGGTKSWAIADAFLFLIINFPCIIRRILCTRELQKSIKESVHKLISDRIHHHNLQHLFEITKTDITCQNGSHFLFMGLKHNITEIKSLEGVTHVWIEEAQKVSQDSLDVLIPTIRTPGSEIWASWNTGTVMDAIWEEFIIKKRDNCKSVLVNFCDNKWLPKELDDEQKHCHDTNYEKWLHVWMGQPVEGGYFFKNFGRHMELTPWVFQPHELKKRLFISYDHGWGPEGISSAGLWWDGYGNKPVRLKTWELCGMTTSDQADWLYEQVVMFHQTGGAMPCKFIYDYSMDTNARETANSRSPIEYFKKRFSAIPSNIDPKSGLCSNWVRANKAREQGWDITSDYFGYHPNMEPKMGVWGCKFNTTFWDAFPKMVADENNPKDVKKCDIDHPCDETRYFLVWYFSRATNAVVRNPAQEEKNVNYEVDSALANMEFGATGG